jgi:hypothetical protein
MKMMFGRADFGMFTLVPGRRNAEPDATVAQQTQGFASMPAGAGTLKTEIGRSGH